MTMFAPASPADREAATNFVGRVAQLDPAALVRLTSAVSADVGEESGSTAGAEAPESVDLWARGGFGVIAHTRIAGTVRPDPLTVYATNLVAALAITRTDRVDPGVDVAGEWHAQIPPTDGWSRIGVLDAAEIVARVRSAKAVAEGAVRIDRADELRARTKATVPPIVLDQAIMTLPAPGGIVPISMRMLFALSGMGFVSDAPTPFGGDGPVGEVAVWVTPTWLRLDGDGGAVARRRMADLPAVTDALVSTTVEA